MAWSCRTYNLLIKSSKVCRINFAKMHTQFDAMQRHTHVYTSCQPLKHKQSTYLTVVLSELVHLNPRDRQRERDRRLRRAHSHRQSCQTSWCIRSLGRSPHARVSRGRSRTFISPTRVQTHARTQGNECNEWSWCSDLFISDSTN